MQQHATDEGVFIRSMASRGHLGGLAATTPQVIRVLDAAGFDAVLIETVGVGQSEVEVAATADTSVVLIAPGMGDSIQAAKAGILEIGDIFVVNKADREGAETTVRELRHMISLGHHEGWRPPVLKTVASLGDGIDSLLAAIDEHHTWLIGSGQDRARKLRRIKDEICALVIGETKSRLATRGAEIDSLSEAVLDGAMDAYAAAEQFS
ncbi:unannotated protein [freshwater metagenome]